MFALTSYIIVKLIEFVGKLAIKYGNLFERSPRFFLLVIKIYSLWIEW